MLFLFPHFNVCVNMCSCVCMWSPEVGVEVHLQTLIHLVHRGWVSQSNLDLSIWWIILVSLLWESPDFWGWNYRWPRRLLTFLWASGNPNSRSYVYRKHYIVLHIILYLLLSNNIYYYIMVYLSIYIYLVFRMKIIWKFTKR